MTIDDDDDDDDNDYIYYEKHLMDTRKQTNKNTHRHLRARTHTHTKTGRLFCDRLRNLIKKEGRKREREEIYPSVCLLFWAQPCVQYLDFLWIVDGWDGWVSAFGLVLARRRISLYTCKTMLRIMHFSLPSSLYALQYHICTVNTFIHKIPLKICVICHYTKEWISTLLKNYVT